MKHPLFPALLVLIASPALAQDTPVCELPADRYDMSAAQIDTFYSCMSDWMAEGYAAEGHEIGANFRSWTQASLRPAVAGVHGERFLNTFANEVAAEQYLKYEEGAFEMPVGSILAKEMIGVRKEANTGRRAPLLIMTKVDDAPDYDNWFYSGVQPNGKAMKVNQNFCHDCHSAFEATDSMGYPVEEARVPN